MSSVNVSATDLMQPSFDGPHLVVLGAGASRAAVPDGDRNGRQLPVMNDLVDTLGLGNLIAEHGGPGDGDDFETLYAHLAETGAETEFLERLENEIASYFGMLELPDEPTLYDCLILCLREKDVIASFNWDPLLWQAACRIASRFGADVVPQILFLHGNAAVGYCMDCIPTTQGAVGTRCRQCGRHLRPSRLLFPVTNKNYSSDPSIDLSWQEVRYTLGGAYILTIFGYSAPTTDAEAMTLMKKAWGDPDERGLETVEVIDIKPEEELLRTWGPFICRDHYSISCELSKSRLMLHPRRSCEGLWLSTGMLSPQPFHPLPENASWADLEDLAIPLIEQERAQQADSTIC